MPDLAHDAYCKISENRWGEGKDGSQGRGGGGGGGGDVWVGHNLMPALRTAPTATPQDKRSFVEISHRAALFPRHTTATGQQAWHA